MTAQSSNDYQLSPFLVVSVEQLAELRQECEARGLETKGNKGELILRLQAYLDEHGKMESNFLYTTFTPHRNILWRFNIESEITDLCPSCLMGNVVIYLSEEDVDVDDVLAEDTEVMFLLKFHYLSFFF